MFDFLSLKKSVQSMQDNMHQLGTELQNVTAEINKVTYAPTHKKDIVAVVENWVNKTGTGFADALIDQIQKHHTDGASRPREVGFFELGQNPNESTTLGILNVAMCAVFGEQIKASMIATVNNMNWPVEGLPAAERSVEISRLQKKAEKIRGQIKELRDQASAAGIEI